MESPSGRVSADRKTESAMKRNLVLAGLCAALGLSLNAAAQETIGLWDFNAGADADPTTGATAPAEGSGVAAALGGVKEAFATGSPQDPAEDNSGWNLSGFPEQGAAPRTAGVEFRLSTAGYEQIALKFDWRASNTAANKLVVLYTADGVQWKEAATFTAERPAWFLTELTAAFGPDADDNPQFAVRLVSDFADAGYVAAKEGSNYSPNGTWRFDMVRVFGFPKGSGPSAPVIVTQPQSQTVWAGEEASFSVAASGALPLAYQWLFNGQPVEGAVNDVFRIPEVRPEDAGQYQVRVSNAFGEVLSEPALLTVQVPEPPPRTDIAALRQLVDPENYLPTDTTNLFTVEGVVTTHVNLTGPSRNVLFYVQDATAGIAVFWKGGADRFIPQAGDKVRVTAPLSHYNGLLELVPDVANPETDVGRLSQGNPLPEPIVLDFSWQLAPDLIEPYEGSYVIASNVWIEGPGGTFPASGNLSMTNEYFETFTLRVDARTDLGGQPIPAGQASVLGVLAQYDRSDPRTGGYQLIPTRYADILSSRKPPSVLFTNYLAGLLRPGDAPTNAFLEHGVRPGESFRSLIRVFDPEGRTVRIEPLAEGLPASAQWVFESVQGVDLTGELRFQPTEADAGKLFHASLRADNGVAANLVTWTFYVPTAAEQRVAIAEYLANPTSDSEAAFFNPLDRVPPVDADWWVNDEYIELVNLSPEEIDLEGWTLSDAVGLRHQFYYPTPLASSNACVVYGGPLNGFPPELDPDVIVEPASESDLGLALNNGGDTIILRNERGGIVARLVYEETAPDGSMTRYPDLNGPFVPQTAVSDLAVSPGRQYDGKRWDEPPTLPEPQPIGAARVKLNADGSLLIEWGAAPGQTYAVETAEAPEGPWTTVAAGLREGRFAAQVASGEKARFYRIRSP